MIKVITKRERIILFITVGLIFFSIVFNYAISPVLTKNDNLNKEINLASAKLKKYLKLLSQKDIIEAKYNERFASVSRQSEQKKDSLVAVLTELEELAKRANIRIIDVRPEAARDLNLHKEISVDLRAEGNTEGYLKFIYDIENSPLFLRIRRFQFNTKPNTQALEGIFSISQPSALE